MSNLKLLMLIILLLTFGSGFLAGILTSGKYSEEVTKPVNHIPASGKQPAVKAAPELQEQTPKVLAGYVQDFRNPAEIDVSKLTHVIFSFAHPAKNGELLMNGDFALKNLRTLVEKAAQYDTRVILAVGGWFHIQGGESYEYFKSAISNDASRTRLVNELASLADRENLDGIDIDFEHPRSQEDAKALTLFTKELGEKLHANEKELSIAVHAKIHSEAGTELGAVIYEPSMFQYVDHVNIMAYDGQWDGGYNASNLSTYSFAENIVSYWTGLFDRHGLARQKLVLGVPLYAQPEDPSVKQLSYAAIIKADPANASRDQMKKNGTTYHYNGYETMKKKANLALNNGFGGMMVWEAGHDAWGTHSLTAAISAAMENPPAKYYILKK
ncbi:glycoside hydrolase family 18 protein [Mesobacillus campisalis]|nr:glycoside hydrolase family 18 protein [Mesobacillus campisalis]